MYCDKCHIELDTDYTCVKCGWHFIPRTEPSTADMFPIWIPDYHVHDIEGGVRWTQR